MKIREMMILKSLDSYWQWIAKDKDGNVGIFHDKPYKKGNIWHADKGYSNLTWLFGYNAFRFLDWYDEEPSEIYELLEGGNGE